MKAVVAAFNQEKALVGAFSVIPNLRMQLFEALILISSGTARAGWVSFSWMATLSGIWSKLVLATSRHPNLTIEVGLG